MDKLGRIDEYSNEERQAHTDLIDKAIHIFENKLSITEDFMSECHDLVVSYYSNFVDVPVVTTPIVHDLEYHRLMTEANLMAINMVKLPIYLAEFYRFSKHIKLMLRHLSELDDDNELSNMMNVLSVKTNTRKLKK